MIGTSICYTEFDSPVGMIVIEGDESSVTGLYLPDHKGRQGLNGQAQRTETLFHETRDQLGEYFAGTRREFQIPLRLLGTPFQQRVWAELAKIPFGETISYVELARRIDQPTASRAVGNANGRNPVSIVIPCHRVVGASGKLTGYAGGIDKKQWLLNWERTVLKS